VNEHVLPGTRGRQLTDGSLAAPPLSLGDDGSSRQYLQLLGRFEFGEGLRPLHVGPNMQRLLALLVLRGGVVDRTEAASTLWPDSAGSKAMANLRTVLWRLKRCSQSAVELVDMEIRLRPGVSVDLTTSLRAATVLLDRSMSMTAQELGQLMRVNLHEDLLPSWQEHWLIAERERFKQLRLHALEMLCERLTNARWYGAAVDAGLAAVRADPFRASAREVLIKTYLTEGNRREAIQEFQAYRGVLRQELGAVPSGRLRELICDRDGTDACGCPLGLS
jgi:DNA-binding SARP family transcriptional activator